MASTNNGSNKGMVPEARAAMDRFKMEAANEVGVNLKEGYNGDLTSRQAGSVGGQMVKKMIPIRTISFERPVRTAAGHKQRVEYRVKLTV
ncbi:MAG: alpha/beta-type small acid-soluble spore protein [Clostridiaceae bacterium]|nr:alpha/beta-type small acid-soluble spore protein [Clostridiaceae bacterium]MDE7035511.1 alpha/beta-type small acid-soluble spore protein [Eubacteriales bacterium]